MHAVPALDNDKMYERFILGGIFISAISYLTQSYFNEYLGVSSIVYLSLALFTLFYFAESFEFTNRRGVFWFSIAALCIAIVFSRLAILRPYLSGIVPKFAIVAVIFAFPWVLLSKRNRPKRKEYLRFALYFVALGAFFLSLSYSSNRLTLKYDSNWSPSALEKTTAYLKSKTRSYDTVMSGAVIWELQAQRRPFLDISHPLEFEHGISDKDREDLEAAIRTKPPEVIILDGFTEKTYFRQLPWLRNFLSSRYDLVLTAEPARQPVRVYQQKGKLESSFQVE
jgi:hypothetical protein